MQLITAIKEISFTGISYSKIGISNQRIFSLKVKHLIVIWKSLILGLPN